MCIGEAKKAHDANPGRMICIGDGVRIYAHPVQMGNPAISLKPGINWGELSKIRRGRWYAWNETRARNSRVVWINNYPGHRPYMDYSKTTRERCFWNSRFKVSPGQVFLTKEELHEQEHITKGVDPNYLVIGAQVKGTHSARNKDWGFSNWQRVSRHFHQKGVPVVSLSPLGTIGLQHCSRIVQPQNFRIACAVISRARHVACTEGGLHHAAAAFGITATVIFGGYISPELTGYYFHKNIYPEHLKSPCGSRVDCDHCAQIMRRITVDEIIASIEEHF